MATVSEPVVTGTLRRHTAETLRLGVPLIGGNLAQIAVQITDTVMLGWYDVEALAAVALGGSWFFVFMIMGAGVAFAVMPMVAAEEASGDRTQIRRITRMGLWLSGLYAALAMPLLIWGGPILEATGQPRGIAAGAGEWLAIAGWGLFPALGMFVVRNYLAALGRTQVAFWTLSAAAVVNAVANYALIFGNFGAPELGIAGAAIASVTTNAVAFLGLAVYAVRVLPEHELFVRFWRPDWPIFARVLRLSWPIGLTNLSEVGLFAASAFMMGLIGTVELAAHGIALQIASATFLVHVGLSSAATIRVGTAWGRGDARDLRQAALAATWLSAGFVVVTIALFLTLPRTLVGLFLDPADPAAPAVLAMGVILLALAALFQAADAGQVMALGYLRGVQDTRTPMVLAAVSYWVVGMPASWVLAFPLGLGAVGVWLGLVAGLTLAGMLLMGRFWRRDHL
jgi:MATE family multidrug resistance protein